MWRGVLGVFLSASAVAQTPHRADDALARIYARYFSSTHQVSEYEDLLEEVKSQVSDDPEGVALVKSAHLTDAEQAALYIYCDDDQSKINHALRGDGKPGFKAAEIKPLTDLIDSALEKIPAYVSNEYVYRGTNFDQETADLHQVGAVVTYTAYTSSSIGERTRNGPLYPYQMSILSKRGRRIKYFSEHAEENEVLFPRNAKFKVLSRTEGPNGKTNLVMEEVLTPTAHSGVLN